MMNNYQHEWVILHGNIESYEKFSLIIKLCGVFVSVFLIAYDINAWLAVVFVSVLWLQDSIWKTFQTRLEERIKFIEQKIQLEPDDGDVAFQLYSQWENNRGGLSKMIKEYYSSAIKPTVAYPYILFIPLLLIFNS